MREKTDLEGVKFVAKQLVMIDIHLTEYSPVVVQHPFTSSGMTAAPSKEGLRLLDITKSEEDLRAWQGYMKGLIDNAKSAYEIYMMVNKPYALTFLSLSEHHMSQEDFSKILGDDGTTRYTKGQVVATITTGKDGKATTEPLYLGKYEIREVKAPYGMVINNEPVNVELVYAGEHVEITETSASFTNERQKMVIDLKKTMENDEIFNIGTNGEITNVQFGMYAAEDMTAADGKVIPKDALIETAYCDKDGNIVFVTDLPVGAKVYVKEIHTDCHYVLNDD